MEIIPRSEGEGEEMRKTALFLLSEAWAKASFSCPLSFYHFFQLVALVLGLSHQRRGSWVGSIRSKGRTERAAVAATTGAGSGRWLIRAAELALSWDLGI